MAASSFPEGFYTRVDGLITEPEAELLYKLASELPKGGTIVEIGAYQARSTCALAFGAKLSNAKVYSIDHHPRYEVGATHYGENDNQAYYANIAHYELGRIVRTINLPSQQVIICWTDSIDLLWIDGSHDSEQVKYDWFGWSWHTDLVAMHDTAGHHPAVSQLVQDIMERGEWAIVEKVDAITVFKRINNIPF
jgi:methyltransferase family protein